MSLVAARASRSSWQAWYAERLVPAHVAAEQIGSGEHVYIPVGVQHRAVVEALFARSAALRDVRITCLPMVDYGWFAPERAGAVEVNVLYASPVSREAVARRI